MWSTKKLDSFLRSILMAINCFACIVVVYIYVTHVGGGEKSNGILSDNYIQTGSLTSENCTSVCDSRACIWHANMFLKNVDSTIDPCENFLMFLCSGFRAQFGPDEKANVVGETNEPMITKLKAILDNIQAKPGSASAKMKTVYDSCVNYDSSELQGAEELRKFLKNIQALNWPNLEEDFNFSDISLPIILGHFITFSTTDYIPLKYSSEQETDGEYLQVFFNHLLFNKTVDVPRELAVSMLKYFDPEMKDIDAIIEDHKLVKDSIMNLSKTHATTCFDEICPETFINCSRHEEEGWSDFCQTLGFVFNFKKVNYSINTKAIAIEKPRDMFFKKLFPLLKTFPNRSLANFIVLSFIKEHQAVLNFYFRLHKLKHKNFEYEIEIEFYELDRWKRCTRWIADNMKLSLMNEFFHQYLTNSVTEEIIETYNYYSSEIIDLVKFQKWIPSRSKLGILNELKDLSFSIDILSRLFPNDTYVDEFYEKFQPTKKTFLSNIFQLKNLKEVIESRDGFHLEKFVQRETNFEVQATADISLEIHFGMLLPPFYVPGHLSLVNRVMMAPIVAHEIGHYIYQILERNNIGHSRKFRKKRQCVWDQFSRFKFEYLNESLDGSKYDTENFPDNIATTLIDKVIEQYSSTKVILPGLPYSTKQLLYMTSVQVWCAKSTLEKDLHHKNEDTHAPTEVRLQTMMQNSRRYPEAFYCSNESFMNPETKCALLDTAQK